MSYGQLDTNSTPYPLRIWGNLSLKKGGGGLYRQKDLVAKENCCCVNGILYHL